MDRFTSLSGGLTSPATDAGAIEPSDTADLPVVARAIYVGGDGDVSLVTQRGSTVTLANVPGGTLLPIRARQVRATGTTATALVWLD